MAHPKPGPHDATGPNGPWNPALDKSSTGPSVKDGTRTFEKTRQEAAPASDPKDGAPHMGEQEGF